MENFNRLLGMHVEEVGNIPAPDDMSELIDVGDMVGIYTKRRGLIDGLVLRKCSDDYLLHVEYVLTDRYGNPFSATGWFEPGDVTLVLKAAAA